LGHLLILTSAAVALHLFSPAITLIIYTIQSQLRGVKSIDVNMAFTSLAIIDIVSTPANILLGILPEAASVIAAFDRIQSYLLSPDREDKRELLDTQCTDYESECNEGCATSVPLDQVAIRLDDVTVRPASTAGPVLRNISTVIKKGSLVVISGAVGTGKTSLAKTLLGDLPPDAGVIQTAYLSIAYCSQAAWLINGTIREAICGPPGDDAVPDEEWYERVVHACGLEEDLSQMPDGNQTVIGSRGITLSGGQKQRVVSLPMPCMFLAFC
jgi:ATP-binding cassette, subfamily C (CFTR/MRP), member 1